MFNAYRGLPAVPKDFPRCALTIGNFDGVHVGHQQILRATLSKARQAQSQAVALIFDPHPMRVVAPDRAPILLSSPAQRLQRFEELGMNAAVVLSFDEQVAKLAPEEFVEQVLVAKLHARSVVVGENFRFGYRQRGDFRTLLRLGEQHGFEVQAVDAVVIDGQPVSSTRIRGLLLQGRVDRARRLLGRPFSLQGPIVPGHGVGSRQTVPTLNQAPETELLPATGVYITSTRDLESGSCWESVTNIGHRPTFDGSGISVETHLLGSFDGDTPKRVEIALYRRLRAEQRFDSPGALREQILRDAAGAARFFRRLQLAGTRTTKTF